jgi:hypothetical protein
MATNSTVPAVGPAPAGTRPSSRRRPTGATKKIADRINQIAREEGYDCSCSADVVAPWRQPEPLPGTTRQAQPQPEQQEGHAYVILRQLVFLLGKEAVKKLIDSL